MFIDISRQPDAGNEHHAMSLSLGVRRVQIEGFLNYECKIARKENRDCRYRWLRGSGVDGTEEGPGSIFAEIGHLQGVRSHLP
jgi:hypothetical protein